MEREKIVRCDKCKYIDVMVRGPIECPHCKEKLEELNMSNAFYFIDQVVSPYLFDDEFLLDIDNKISFIKEECIKEEYTYTEFINEYIDFLKDLVIDNLNDTCLNGENFIAVRNISIDLYHLTKIKMNIQ